MTSNSDFWEIAERVSQPAIDQRLQEGMSGIAKNSELLKRVKESETVQAIDQSIKDAGSAVVGAFETGLPDPEIDYTLDIKTKMSKIVDRPGGILWRAKQNRLQREAEAKKQAQEQDRQEELTQSTLMGREGKKLAQEREKQEPLNKKIAEYQRIVENSISPHRREWARGKIEELTSEVKGFVGPPQTIVLSADLDPDKQNYQAGFPDHWREEGLLGLVTNPSMWDVIGESYDKFMVWASNKKAAVETKAGEAAFNELVSRVGEIGKQFKGMFEFNIESPSFLEAVAESFPAPVVDLVSVIMERGPENPEEEDLMNLIMNWGQIEHDGVSPELMENTRREAQIRTQNVSRSNARRKIDEWKGSFQTRTILNEDGSIDRRALRNASMDLLKGFVDVLQEDQLEDGFAPLLEWAFSNTEEWVNQYGRALANIDPELAENAIVEIIARQFAESVEGSFNEQVERRNGLISAEAQPAPDIYRVMETMFNEIYGGTYEGELVQTPFDDTTIPYKPNGWELLSEEAQSSITAQVIREKAPQPALPMWGLKGLQARDLQREGLDKLLDAYDRRRQIAGTGVERITNEYFLTDQTKNVVDQALAELKSGELSPETDYQYIALVLNKMGLANIDTTVPFGAGDVEGYITALTKAQSVLDKEFSILEDTYYNLVDPRFMYNKLMMDAMGDKLRMKFNNIEEVNALVYDVIKNPNNYDRGSRMGILTTYNLANNLFSDLETEEEEDTKWRIELGDLRTSALGTKGNLTKLGRTPMGVLFDSSAELRRAVMDDEHPVAVQMQEEAFMYFEEKFAENYAGIMEATDPEWTPEKNGMPTFRQVLGPNFVIGGTVNWQGMPQHTRAALASTFIKSHVDTSPDKMSSALKGLQAHMIKNIGRVQSGDELVNMPKEDQVEAFATFNMAHWLLQDTKRFGLNTKSRALIKELLVGEGPNKHQKFLAMKAWSTVASKLAGPDTLVELIDVGALMAAEDPAEMQLILNDRLNLPKRTANILYNYIGKTYTAPEETANLASGANSFYNVNRKTLDITKWDDELKRCNLAIPSEDDDNAEEDIRNMYYELKAICRLPEDVAKEIEETTWMWISVDPGYNEYKEGIRKIIYQQTENAATRRLLGTLNSAWVTSMPPSMKLSPVELFELADVHTTNEGYVPTNKGHYITAGRNGDQDGLIDAMERSDTIPRPATITPKQWEDTDPSERLTMSFNNFAGNTDPTKRPIHWEKSLGQANEAMWRATFPDEEYTYSEARNSEFASIRNKAIAFEKNVAKDSGYTIMDNSWMKSPQVRATLKTNFNPTQLKHIQAALIEASPRGTTEAEVQVIFDELIDGVIRDYSSGETSAAQLRLARRDRLSLEGSIKAYKPTLLDLHCEVYARLHERILELRPGSRGIIANATSLGGEVLEGTKIRKYRTAKIDFRQVNMGDPSIMSPDTEMSIVLTSTSADKGVPNASLELAWVLPYQLFGLRDDKGRMYRGLGDAGPASSKYPISDHGDGLTRTGVGQYNKPEAALASPIVPMGDPQLTYPGDQMGRTPEQRTVPQH